MKTSIATAAAALLLSLGTASAQTPTQPGAYGPVPAPTVRPQAHPSKPTPAYGVGYTGPSSATGGPVGGYPSRN